MSIDRIDPYPMPGEPDLPPNVVAWRPDPSRAALLVHDMQRYFVRFLPEGRSPAVELISRARALLDAARAAGVPVYYTAQPGAMTAQERGLLADFWGPGMTRDAGDREIVPELAPGPGDVILTKWRYSAFVRSDLHRRLVDGGRDQLIVCGVYAHVGCLVTANDAMARDIQPFLVADAVADFSADHHRLALEYAAERCAAVVTTDAVVRELGRVRQPLAAAPGEPVTPRPRGGLHIS
ncbi:isochorismatase family protein [Blastococcus sp. KM273128]|uniref:isochorismatase family protein n=1 Tax=Blastococcus sp. KM273128 TaxID=2570314 RepID=UPI0027155C1C|nr:isochorismatase family protein [Blastococcus sp. KM273128]MCF6744042.1 isochorismatase family protein [Blastococcus sp. KM273128]